MERGETRLASPRHSQPVTHHACAQRALLVTRDNSLINIINIINMINTINTKVTQTTCHRPYQSLPTTMSQARKNSTHLQEDLLRRKHGAIILFQIRSR